MTSTEHPTDDETPEAVSDGPEDAADGPADPAEGDGPAPGRARALRERAQHAETRVADLEAELDGYRRAAVETYAGRQLVDPEDLWHHHELAGLLGDDGTVDTDAVDAALGELRRTKQHLFARRRPAPDPSQGSSANSRDRGGDPGERWAQVVKGR